MMHYQLLLVIKLLFSKLNFNFLVFFFRTVFRVQGVDQGVHVEERGQELGAADGPNRHPGTGSTPHRQLDLPKRKHNVLEMD